MENKQQELLMVKEALKEFYTSELDGINSFFELFEEAYEFDSEELIDALTDEEMKKYPQLVAWTGSVDGDDLISYLTTLDNQTPIKVVVQDASTLEMKYSKVL